MHIIGTKADVVVYPCWKAMDKVWNFTKTYAQCFHAHYMNNYVPKVIKFLGGTNNLKNKGINLFCTGTSGITIAICFKKALEDIGYTKVKIQYIRKDHEVHHEGTIINDFDKDYTNIIVDDFIKSGKSILRLIEKINVEIDYLIVDDVDAFFKDWPIKNIIFNAEMYQDNVLNRLNAKRFIYKDGRFNHVYLFG